MANPNKETFKSGVYGERGQTRRANIGNKVTKGDLIANAKDYGAIGNGVVNDTVAIQAALAAAPAVYLPPGSYVASAIQLGNGQRLFGAGIGVTKILHNQNSDGIYAFGSSGAHYSGVEISDLSLICNGNVAGVQRGIFLQWCDASAIRNVYISGAGNNCINYYNARGGSIEGCEITGARDFGVLVYQSSLVAVTGCHVHHIQEAARSHLGIQFKSSQSCRAAGNLIHDIAGYGIYTWSDGTQAATANVVTQNVIADITAASFAALGINIDTSSNTVVSQNSLANTGANGVSVIASTGIIIVDNQMTAVTSVVPGIGVSSASKYVNIVGNYVAGYDQGIVLDAATYCKVTKNTIRNLQPSASSLSAGIRLRNTSTNCSVEDNLIIDDQGTPTTRRGVYEELGGTNEFFRNKAFNTTVNDYQVISSPIGMGNVRSSGPIAYVTGGSVAWPGEGTWTTYTPTWTATTTNPTLGNGTLTGRFTVIGKTTHVYIRLVIGSTTTLGTGNFQWALPNSPAQTRAVGSAILISSGANDWIGTAFVTAGILQIKPDNASGSVSAAVPFAWTTGDEIGISITYENT